MHAALRRRRGVVASTTALTLASSTLTVFALTSQGYPAIDVHKANDSVWVTNSGSGAIGRLNQQIAHLDSAATTSAATFDVLQGGGVVKVYQSSDHKLRNLDPTAVALDDGVVVPTNAQVAMNGGTITILNTDNGSLWVESTTSISQFNDVTEKPAADLEKGAVVAVGSDGVVHAVDVVSGELWTIVGKPGGGLANKTSVPLGVQGAAVQVTAVGADAVVWDSTHGTLILPNSKSVHVGQDLTFQLQQPGPANDRVLVEGAAGLSVYPLGGGAPQLLYPPSGDAVVNPVWLDGCAHGAWGGATPVYVRACDHQAPTHEAFTIEAGTTHSLVFRVNDGVLALNDASGGGVWLADQALTKVNDWDAVTKTTDDQSKGGPTRTGGHAAVTESKKNRPPHATDDAFGARPGVATDLPVLANDSDPDGDVLVVDKIVNPVGGTASITGNGQAVQFAFAAGATAAGTFSYEISDGNGGTDTAPVTVNPRAAGSNTPPDYVVKTGQDVELGKTLRFDALSGWQDADGDPTYLVGVKSDDTADSVSFTPDGSVSFLANDTQGGHNLEVTVSDGMATSLPKTEVVTVHAAGAEPPVAHNDFAVTHVNEPVTLHPLLNDTDGNDDPLRLVSVTNTGTATLTTDLADGSVTVQAPVAGPYTFLYTLVDQPTGAPPQSTTGRIRVDVQPAAANAAPVAVADVASASIDEPTDVNVLSNDSDPDGDVLVVQSVDVPVGSPIQASVVGHEVVHLTTTSTLTAPVTLHYTISDGQFVASAPITVVPGGDNIQPPVAVDDQAVVRAGDVATIPALANDIDPQGGKLSLFSVTVPDPIAPATQAAGTAFIAGDQIRYLAPTTAQQVMLTYVIVDDAGQQATGQITVNVTAVDPTTDKAPTPAPVEARVFADTTVKIPIPLGGVDPDGDSVILLGETSAPLKGRIVARGTDSLTYQAYQNSAGTDTFTYGVRDPYGKVGESTVRVGISPHGSVNQSPLAVDDVLRAGPGKVVSVPVLANDVDPDGDPISFDATKPLTLTGGLEATEVGDHIVVHVPEKAGSYSAQYFITDGKLGGSAVLSVTSDKDAPTAFPQPHDDYVRYLKPDTATYADVDVLSNDTDPDGPNSQLTISIPPQESALASVLPAPSRKVRVVVGAQPRTVVYDVTDADNNKASATIYVPGQGNQPPQPAVAPPSVSTNEGSAVTLDIAQFAFDPEGAKLRLTDPSKVVASSGTAAIKDPYTIVFTPNPKYNGGASVTFEVTDGTGPDDPQGLKATFSVPIKVIPTADVPPTFRGSLVLLNEGSPVTVDLRVSSSDPDDGDEALLAYDKLTYPADRVTASLKGSELTLSARSPAQAGQIQIQFTVSDGKSAAVPAELSVQIVPKPVVVAQPGQSKPTQASVSKPTPTPTKSTLPPPPLAHAVADSKVANEGVTVFVRPLENDQPPPGFTIKIVAAKVVVGGGTVSSTANTVSWVPPKGFFGAARLTYTIQDSTGLPGRTVDGSISVTIKGFPGQPQPPTATVAGAGAVTLSWAAPAANGSPITSYSIQASGVDKACSGAQTGATTCTVTDLTPGVAVTFTVTPRSAIGWGKKSLPSVSVTPNIAPNAPAAPTVTHASGVLTVSWAAPPTAGGSPITGYNLQISPPVSGGPSNGEMGLATSYTWTGLTNGTVYEFKVAAENAQGLGAYSSNSADERPSDKPATPDVPTATNSGGPLGRQITVNWGQPANNGDAISGYTIAVTDNGTSAPPVTVGPTPTNYVLAAQNGHEYTFRVAATNRDGSGNASAASTPTTSFGAPDAINSVVLTAGNRSVVLGFSPPSSNGSPISKYQALNGGTWVNFQGPNTAITGLTNGKPYSFAVRACNGPGSSNCGDASPVSNSVNPHGTPTPPSVQMTNINPGSIHFQWDAGDGQGCTVTGFQLQVDGGAWADTSAPSTQDVGNSYNATHELAVRAITSDCGTPTSASVSGNTGLKPLQSDASYAFGTCPPGGNVNYCGGISHSFATPAFVSGGGVLVPQYTNLHGMCWTLGGNVTGTQHGLTSIHWVKVSDAPNAGVAYLNFLYFPDPNAVIDGLPQC